MGLAEVPRPLCDAGSEARGPQAEVTGAAGPRLKKKERFVIVNKAFRSFSDWSAAALGSPWVFAANIFLILVWLALGPLFGYSDTWQLWVNTATTVITYLAVFVIQNTQNRDAVAVHLKLDELISSIEGARNRLVDLQNLSDEELEVLQQQFSDLQRRVSRGDVGDTRGLKGEPG
jgi:low affinity Fe/Cu permease